MPHSQEAKNVLIIELNEFNVELLTHAVGLYPLPALAKVLAMPRSQYKTNDRYNSGYLEPWVQWVSIHTGVPSSLHKIKHLGDVPDLRFAQCWETLSHHGITSGVWGVMNGARNEAKNTLFFLPDPWTFSEKGSPPEIDHLLALPRYVSKNYQQLRKRTLLKYGFALLKFILSSKTAMPIFRETLALWNALRRYGKSHFVYISYFDYIFTLLFIQYKIKYQPQCAFLFLNSLAHLEHHHWHESATSISPELLYGLKYIDKLLSLLFSAFPKDAIVVHNGLSQMNTNHEKPWVLYRQKNPISFFKALNVPAIQVEQHMTHDGHIFFASLEEATEYYQYLKAATLHQKSLFHVEKNLDNPCKLFYQLNFTDNLVENENVEFEFREKKYRFFDYFDKIVTRTGRHIPIGTIYSDTIEFPDHIYNHDFNRYLFHYLNPDLFSLRKNIEHELFASLGEV